MTLESGMLLAAARLNLQPPEVIPGFCWSLILELFSEAMICTIIWIEILFAGNCGWNPIHAVDDWVHILRCKLFTSSNWNFQTTEYLTTSFCYRPIRAQLVTQDVNPQQSWSNKHNSTVQWPNKLTLSRSYLAEAFKLIKKFIGAHNKGSVAIRQMNCRMYTLSCVVLFEL